MDYEKAYKAVLNTAKQWIKDGCTDKERICLECVFSELRESEDSLEFLKGQAIEMIASIEHDISQSVYDGIKGHSPEDERELERWKKALAYLEKQKEQKTDAKSERVIKAARRVLNNWLDGTDCPDVSGNFTELEYAIREYDGEEKQKEQKPVEIHIDNPNIQKVDPNVKISTSDSSASGDELLYVSNKSYRLGYQDGKREAEQKPAEWNEEERDKVAQYLHDRDGGMLWSKATEITSDILDILRPSWKPSEEQMEALERASTNKYLSAKQFDILVSLYEQLKKLM